MMQSNSAKSELAVLLEKAKVEATARQPLTEQLPSLSVVEGYEIQRQLLEFALGRGAQLCGYKMGLTSKAKQRDVNVHEPIRGFLLREMQESLGGEVSVARRIHPRVEPEIAVVAKNRLYGRDISYAEVISNLAWVGPALEILDSRYHGYSFKLPDVVADNTSASGFMLGTTNWLSRLGEIRLFGVNLRKNGEILETGAPAAVLGDPLLAVVELVRGLAKEDLALEPGMVVLTGGITAAVPFQSGDVIEIDWPGETMSFRGAGERNA